MVEDDHYKQGLTVNQRTERDHRAAELGIEAEFVLGADGGRIRVLLRPHPVSSTHLDVYKRQVYTEILMWIERKIEGERPARMKLDAQPMNARKFRLKLIKHSLWLLIALWTGITFVGYFTPIKDLLSGMASFELGPWEAFWIFFYAAFLYMMAGFMREQVCKYMCPYARFQGVMFDPDTLIISYDPERGEPRGLRRKRCV